MSRAQASVEIRKIIALNNQQKRKLANEPLTEKQKYLLISNGIEIKNMNKLDAMIAISKLKRIYS